MQPVENSSTPKEIEKPYRLTRSEYMQWKNDQKSKKILKSLVLLVWDKVKKWESGENISTLK